MLKDITIGQHFPGHSILHRCDPRLKLVATIAYIVVLFVAPNPLGLALSILLLAALYKVAQIPGRMILKSLKPIVPIVIFTAVLNLFFVVVCGLGVAGVGIASAASQWLSAVLVVLALSKREDACRFMPQALRITPDKARLLLSMGVPAGFQNAIFAIANLFIQSGVNSFDAIVVDGNSAAANADSLVYDVMAAFYIACSTFMSQNLGAGRRKRVLQSYFVSLAYSFGAGAVLGALLLLFGRQFLALFTPDSAVIDEGIRRLQVMAFSYAFSAFMDNTIAASRGLGKSLVPTIIVMMGSCVFRVVWIYTVFAHFHTLPSLYLLYIFSWTITAVAEILYFVHCYRAQINRPGLSGGELSKAQ